MTDQDYNYRRQLSSIADAAEAEMDRYEGKMRRIREELQAQSQRADRRRARAKLVRHMRKADLIREAELIESVVRQIRKAMA